MAGIVHVPWYATGFRGEELEHALTGIAPVALRYGATEFALHRSRDDRYKILQLAHFDEKLQWESYWFGPEFIELRVRCSSWYQVPVLYVWHDLVTRGGIAAADNGIHADEGALANGG